MCVHSKTESPIDVRWTLLIEECQGSKTGDSFLNTNAQYTSCNNLNLDPGQGLNDCEEETAEDGDELEGMDGMKNMIILRFKRERIMNGDIYFTEFGNNQQKERGITTPQTHQVGTGLSGVRN